MTTRALALATVVSGALLAGCTSANESVSIGLTATCAFTDDCTFKATCDAQYIGIPVVDANAATEFWLPVQVDNRLADNSDESIGRVNTNNAHITSIFITYDNFALAESSVSVNFSVPAGGAATVGVPVIPPQSLPLTAPAATVQSIAHVVAKGYYDNGSTFETGDYPVAFTYCAGCVTTPSAGCDPLTEVTVITCGSVGTYPIRVGCQKL